VFTVELSGIEIINAGNNEIIIVNGTEKIRNISKLLLEGNKLVDFPKCDFPNIKILSLKRNPITSF
jgi:Leucine-rich repeat (LRR) protein